MAELVSFAGEKLLPEYEYMRQRRLFTNEEIRMVVKTRERMHYKISNSNRTKRDFVEYIKYENNLLRTIKNRETATVPSSLQNSMIDNIRNLYKIGLSHYPDLLRFWDEYIKFLKLHKFNFEIHSCYEKMLKLHGDKPHIWSQAAIFEYDVSHDIDRAMEIFFRGLQRHPENMDLHLDMFKVMLNETSKMNTDLVMQNNTLSEQKIGLEKLQIIYRNSKKKITGVEYYIDVLGITELYSFTKSLQKLIITDMMTQFPLCEEVWDVFAKRELKGFSFCDLIDLDEELDNNSQNTQQDSKDLDSFVTAPGFRNRTLKQRINYCTTMYTSGVKELKTEKMWSYYLKAMLQLNEDTSTLKNYKREQLGLAFKAADEAKMMSESFYDIYIDLLKENKSGPWDLLIQIMNNAIEIYPDSIKLWEHLLTFYIVQNEVTMVEQSFERAKEKLGPLSAKLYKILLQYYQTIPDQYDKLDEIYNEACKETAEDFLNFRTQYLEFTAIIKEDFSFTRKLYDELTLLPPGVLNLHETMAYLESKQLNPDIPRWRKCYENAANFFGNSNIQVWIDYLRFERDHGEPKNLTLLFERAKGALDTKFVANFIQTFNYL